MRTLIATPELVRVRETFHENLEIRNKKKKIKKKSVFRDLSTSETGLEYYREGVEYLWSEGFGGREVEERGCV